MNRLNMIRRHLIGRTVKTLYHSRLVQNKFFTTETHLPAGRQGEHIEGISYLSREVPGTNKKLSALSKQTSS